MKAGCQLSLVVFALKGMCRHYGGLNQRRTYVGTVGGHGPPPTPHPPQDFEKIYRTVLYLTKKIKIYPKKYILAPLLQNIYILTHETKKNLL